MIDNLILSIFPDIDLFGRAFETLGFCVLRGPDPIYGGDIREFTPPRGVFSGIIGGTPCQDFSKARRSAPSGYGLEMIAEFKRVVETAAPAWYILENVPAAPDVRVPGYSFQRIDLNARDCGSIQRRLRHFQFGSRDDYALIIERTAPPDDPPAPACLASEGTQQERRSWNEFIQLMDLPPDYDLPGWSLAAKYRAVGNGVPLKMGMVIAKGVRDLKYKNGDVRLCACGCGRVLTGRQKCASPACRKRLQRQRERAQAVTE